MTTLPKNIQALLLLDDYARAQEGAQCHFRSTLWNLNKARRQKGRESTVLVTGISVEDVREELRARAALLMEEAPELVEEAGNDEKETKGKADRDLWTLIDRVQVAEERTAIEKENEMPSSSSTSTTPATGLRHRKASTNKEDTNSSKWTQENEESDVPLSDEERLLKADPLQLIGGAFPPRDLRVAQEEARTALATYVKMANLAAAILELTNTTETKK
jgi:hypothetical protein